MGFQPRGTRYGAPAKGQQRKATIKANTKESRGNTPGSTKATSILIYDYFR